MSRRTFAIGLSDTPLDNLTTEFNHMTSRTYALAGLLAALVLSQACNAQQPPVLIIIQPVQVAPSVPPAPLYVPPIRVQVEQPAQPLMPVQQLPPIQICSGNTYACGH